MVMQAQIAFGWVGDFGSAERELRLRVQPASDGGWIFVRRETRDLTVRGNPGDWMISAARGDVGRARPPCARGMPAASRLLCSAARGERYLFSKLVWTIGANMTKFFATFPRSGGLVSLSAVLDVLRRNIRALTPRDPREAYLRAAIDENDLQNRLANIEKGYFPSDLDVGVP